MSVRIERVTPEKSSSGDNKEDQESYKGRFGWIDIQKKQIPYIFRGDKKEQYASVRIVEEKILHSLLTCLPKPLVSFYGIQSYYITAAECRLLNDINTNHTGGYFGKTSFNEKDTVIKLKDATEYTNYVLLCYRRIVKKEVNPTDRCGFVIIGGDGILPYVRYNDKKCIPLFYLEDEDITAEISKASIKIGGWDMVYLKFCCKIQGIKATLYASDECKVVPLDKVIPDGTQCEDYWPATHEYNQIGFTRVLFAGGWTFPPVGKPSFIGKQLLSPEEYETGIQVAKVVPRTAPPPTQSRQNQPTITISSPNQRRGQLQSRTTDYRAQTANLIAASKQLTNSFIQRKSNPVSYHDLRNQVTITSLGSSSSRNANVRSSPSNKKSSVTQRR